MQNRNLICIYAFLAIFGHQASAQPTIPSDDMWNEYGITCLKHVPGQSELSGLPIAILKREFFKWGVVFFATDKHNAYLLWASPGYPGWLLFREPLDSIEKQDPGLRGTLERFELTKSTSTCDRLDLTFFRLAPGTFPGPDDRERKVIQIRASLEHWKFEDGKGEFGDPAFIAYGLRATMSEISKSGRREVGPILFERTSKIRKRIKPKLSGADDTKVKLIDVLSQHVCEHQRQAGWIENLPSIECIKMLKGEPSVFDQTNPAVLFE